MSCFKGDIPTMQWCFNHDVDVNQCRNDETTPLLVAAKKGWSEIVKILLFKGADYNKCYNNGLCRWSPLISACHVGHTDIVRMLLDIGVNYDECYSDGWSQVMSVCRYGHTEIVRMLLDIGAEYNKCENKQC